MQLSDSEKSQFMEQFYRDNFAKVQRFCSLRLEYLGMPDKQAAYDLTQTTFAEIQERPHDFFNADSQINWIYGIARNKIREHCAKERRSQNVLKAVSSSESYRFEHGVEVKADLEKLIPPQDLKLLRQIYVEGYTYEELCSAYHIKKSALAMRIHRIKMNFRKKYDE